jgi:prepilin-type N-terminal cleavage/methylation domain-containing protein
MRMRRPTRIRSAQRTSRGFTLVELVSVLVIVGSVAAIAQQAYLNLRYDARRATLETIRTAMRANLISARAAYMTQGMTPGPAGQWGPAGTVQVASRAVEVNGEGVNDGQYVLPPGSPTSLGMWTMLDCGTPIDGTVSRCEALPGLEAVLLVPEQQLLLRFNTYCHVLYQPAYAVRKATRFGADWLSDGQGTLIRAYRPTDANPMYAEGSC